MGAYLDVDHSEIERRKQLRRDLFAYRRVGHIPVFIWLYYNSLPGCAVRDELQSTEIQFQVNLDTIKKTLALVPDDYIPFATITQGCMTIETMCGAQVHWGDDSNQMPGVAEHIVQELDQVYSLRRPTMADGIMPENIRRLCYHAENLPPDVYLSGPDIGGPLNKLQGLLATDLLYTGFYDNPHAMHHLLNMVTDVQIELCRTLIDTVGGINRFANIDFGPAWAPEGYKGYCTDDVCATLSPGIWEEFGLPYNSRIYQAIGRGGFHNCGPHPCKYLYPKQSPRIKYLNCSYKYSHKEIPEFRDIFAGWGIVEVTFDANERPEEIVEGFRYVMECLAPDTLAAPVVIVDPSWPDDDITALYWDMRRVGEEYARNMNFRGDTVKGDDVL